jgi:hypothetical protein
VEKEKEEEEKAGGGVEDRPEADTQLFLCEKGRCERLFTETVCLKVQQASYECLAQCCGSGIRCFLTPWIRV